MASVVASVVVESPDTHSEVTSSHRYSQWKNPPMILHLERDPHTVSAVREDVEIIYVLICNSYLNIHSHSCSCEDHTS